MKDVVIIPTYNERGNVSDLIKKIHNTCPDLYVLVVDDNSSDGTGNEVENLIKSNDKVALFRRPKKTGLGDAHKSALLILMGDKTIRNIITMDADGSHNPSDLPKILKAAESFDLVIGSRYVKGGGVMSWVFWRRFLSKMGNIYAGILTGLPIRDLTAGFVCVRHEILNKINLHSIGSGGYAYQIEFKYQALKRARASFLEVPIIFLPRLSGLSKISLRIIIEGIKLPLKIRFLNR